MASRRDGWGVGSVFEWSERAVLPLMKARTKFEIKQSAVRGGRGDLRKKKYAGPKHELDGLTLRRQGMASVTL